MIVYVGKEMGGKERAQLIMSSLRIEQNTKKGKHHNDTCTWL